MAAEVRRVPDEVHAFPEVRARTLFHGLNDGTLILRRAHIELFSHIVEGYDGAIRGVILNPAILARSRQTAHHNHLSTRVVIRVMPKRTIRSTEIQKARVIGWELQRPRETAPLLTMRAKELDVI